MIGIIGAFALGGLGGILAWLITCLLVMVSFAILNVLWVSISGGSSCSLANAFSYAKMWNWFGLAYGVTGSVYHKTLDYGIISPSYNIQKAKSFTL